MNDLQDIDIFVSGGGVAGLAATIAFAQAGFTTLCADPAPPITDRDSDGADLRTTAFLQPSQAFLNRIGLWPRLADHATPLQVMRIVDAGGPEPVARASHDFDAADISDAPFGWNLPNWLLRREMVAHIESLPNATFRPGTGTADVLTRATEARIRLSDGTRLRAKLIVAADGRNSPVREAVGVPVQTTRYGQKALAFAVTHDAPHGNVSTEIHRTGGPFTLVPLPDHEGRPCSAIVWMEPGPEAQRLAALPEPAFEAEMTERSAHLYGPLKLVSRRTIWPIISQKADRLTAERTALVAEAAHVVPPIGAQGLNMSLGDIEALLDQAEANRDDPGAADGLARYNRARWPEISARVAGVDALNRASMTESQPLRDMRMRALGVLHAATPVRKTLMRMGLGTKG
ncbi:UbiH/UbiF family hydroxylase [Gymnodinialimonas hymeniacidonis]|uniref:UbiH/UbiF family hydroxylase n=1 Tax=Gymnodinialimonas hymeniacidonis TaxID=3126508 RepID=UPI0034C615D3